MLSHYLQIAKELGSDKRRFASSPEGWSIIPQFDDEPAVPLRRHAPPPTTEAPKSPSKRKSPPAETLEEPVGGRRRTKSASEWWKVEKSSGEQQHGGGGGNNGELVSNEDEDIDIINGAISPISPAVGKPLTVKSKKGEAGGDGGAVAGGGEQPAPAAVLVEPVVQVAEEELPQEAPVVEKPKPEPAAAAIEKPEKAVAEVAANDVKEEGKPGKKEKPAEPTPPLDSTAKPSLDAPAPAPAPAPKGFVIPKRRSTGTTTAPATTAATTAAAAAAGGGGSKDASAHQRNSKPTDKSANDRRERDPPLPTGDSKRLRRPPSLLNLTDPSTAGTAGKPPLPAPPKKQPWETMLKEIHGPFASAWKRLEWPQSAATIASLPQPKDPKDVTEEQKAAWQQARSRFGALPPVVAPELPPTTAPDTATTAAVGPPQDDKEMMSLATTTATVAPTEKEKEKNEKNIEVLHQLTQDPYPPHPPELTYVRIMQFSTTVSQQCLDRMVFAANHRADTDGIEPGRTMIVLHNFDKHIIYGCYRAVEVGSMLDSRFPLERSHQVRVEPIQVFSPLPSYLLEAFLPRKHNQIGEPMKFFDKGTPNVKEVWHLMQIYSNKGFKIS
jgi:hypothetical protein